jgi:hypothetical protein
MLIMTLLTSNSNADIDTSRELNKVTTFHNITRKNATRSALVEKKSTAPNENRLLSSSNSKFSKLLNNNSERRSFLSEFETASSECDDNETNESYEDELESSGHFELYKSSPSILYIKQKYKMYLEWLSENYGGKKKESTNKKITRPNLIINQLKNSNNANQLCWYDYEKSFQEKRKSEALNANKERSNLKNQNRRHSSIIDASLDKSNSGFDLEKTINSKGVKFSTVNNETENNNIYQGLPNSSSNISANSSSNNIKPILKASSTNIDTNLIRRASMCSLLSTQSTLDKSNTNLDFLLARANAGMITPSLKLPPIAKCSEDFYAVLNDLEK